MNWQKKLLFFEKTPSDATVAARTFADVDDSVAAAVLLAPIAQALAAGRSVWLAAPRPDFAEELRRQFTIWRETLRLSWRIALLPEIQRGKFYVAGGEAERARVLGELARGEIDLLIASLPALLAPAPRPETLQASEVILAPGTHCPFAGLLETLVKLDYDDEFEVSSPGEFARRGGIVDIFSPAEERPGRIEFFGDEIESIRAFDPETQRSLPGELPGYRIIHRCTAQSLAFSDGEEEHAAVPAGDGLDFFQSGKMLFYQLTPAAQEEYFQRFGGETEKNRFREFLAELPEGVTGTVYGAGEAAVEGTAPCGVYPALAHLAETLPEEARDRSSALAAEQLLAQIRQWRDSGYRVFFCGGTPESPARLRGFLERNNLGECAGDIVPVQIPGGVLDFAGQFVLLSENELLTGRSGARRELKTGSGDESANGPGRELKLENTVIADLSEGDYAVHLSHGIGIFRGLKTVTARDGESKEVMVLEYADNAMLHVPLHQAHNVSRYIGGGKGSTVKLHRLGGVKWNHDKVAAAEAVHQYAAEMLRVRAVRAASTSWSYRASWRC